MAIGERLQHAWNAFMNKDPTQYYNHNIGGGSSLRPDRIRYTRGNERTIIAGIYNRIAVDCSQIDFKHVRLDDNGRYVETIEDGLNNCLTLEANKDQTAKAFIHDLVASMLDEGYIASVPIDTDINPETNSFDIESMRVGKIVEWYPDHVKVLVYNDRKGIKEERTFLKRNVSIIENPFYSVMNEHNSVLQRLVRKLNLLDAIDEQCGSGKLDLIIQLPYQIKTDARRAQAKARKQEIEDQLANSKYGIAYTDGTEHITQLNRSLDNNLMGTIEYLTKMLHSQLGITENILNGTADEKEMLNYYNHTIEPILSAIVDEYKRKFLTKTARTQKQSILFFRDPFKLVPVNDIAEIADKMTRNEIMTSNELRQIVGLKPSKDPSADELRNKNLSQPASAIQNKQPVEEENETIQ